MPKTVLVFTAHPDDAEYYTGGTIAKMIKQGAQVTYVVTTDGRRGSFQHQTGILAPIREEEANHAAQVMGAESPILLSHPDHELDRLPPGKLKEQYCRLIRQHKPDAIIAQDPFSTYESHPDPPRRSMGSIPRLSPKPILFNEDDHFDFDKPFNNMVAAVGEYASWGYFDPGQSNYADGYQCPPVNWRINTPRKQDFFSKVRDSARRYACPALKRRPCSPIWVSYPSGRVSMKASAWASRAA